MRIIFANNYFFLKGGSERIFFEEIRLLQSEGHKVATFSVKHGDNLESPYDHYFPNGPSYENRNMFEYARGLLKFIYSHEAKKKFSKLIDAFGADIIHLHNVYGRLTTSIIDGAKKKNIPVIMTAHDYKLACPTYLMLNKNIPCDKCLDRRYIRCLIERCHKEGLIGSLAYTIESYFNSILNKYDYVKYIICPSKFLFSKLTFAGWQKDKLEYIPNFVDVESLKPNFEVGDYILYFGRLSEEKGIRLLLEIARKIPVKLKIVGEGPLKQELRSYAIKEKIENIEFLGYKTGTELYDLIKSSSFVVLPALWFENAPLSIIEAFALGKPVVASNIGGIPEMVINGETGLLAKPGNAEDLRLKIMYLITNSKLIQEMGSKARKNVETMYSSKHHLKLLLDLYKRAIS